MSKLRQQVETSVNEHDFASPLEGDFRAWAILTQLRKDGPHLLAGYLDAPDSEMALVLAKEHYGQDQPCLNIWAVPVDAIAGTEPEHPTSSDATGCAQFEVFIQKIAGDPHESAMLMVEAEHSEAALESAKMQLGERAAQVHSIWVAPRDEIAATEPGELIWRTTDQTYRLARGYSKGVREKWERIRVNPDIDEYEKDDLKETF